VAETKEALFAGICRELLVLRGELGSFDSLPQQLMPLVRSRQSISMVLLRLARRCPVRNSTETAWAPIAGDLVSAIGVDRPGAISVLARNNPQHLNISFEHALERAIENFERQPVTFVEARGRFPRGVHSGIFGGLSILAVVDA
jgi:hypothetical protein